MLNPYQYQNRYGLQGLALRAIEEIYTIQTTSVFFHICEYRIVAKSVGYSILP